MESVLETRLHEDQVLIISSVSDEDEPQMLDSMMGLLRPGCYEECMMEKLAAVGPGSSDQFPNLLLSSKSSFSYCHCSSVKHGFNLFVGQKFIPNCRRFPFEIPITERPKRQMSF